MSLRRRTLLLLTLLLIALIWVLYFVLRQIIVSGFETVERENVRRDLNRAENALIALQDDLYHSQPDWSNWTASYEFVQTGDPLFRRDNLTPDTLDILDLDFMLFLDARFEEVAWFARREFPSSDILYARFSGLPDGEETLLDAILTQPAGARFVLLDNAPFIVSTRPILTSLSTPPPAGVLIWGRALEASILRDLSAQLEMDIAVTTMPDLRAEQPRTITTEGRTAIARSTLSALNGTVVVSVTTARDLLTQVEVSVLQFTAVLILFGGLLITSGAILIDTTVLARIGRMIDALKGMDRRSTAPIPEEGTDELASLARAINAMLHDTAESRRDLEALNHDLERRVSARTVELTAHETQLRAIVDTMGEGLIYSVNGVMQIVNPALAEIIGYDAGDLIGRPFRSLLFRPENLTITDISRRPDRFETQLVHREGRTIDVAVTSTPLPMIDGASRRVIIVRDITRERALQRQRDYFFARASHELRTPLTNIMTRLYLLERDPGQRAHHLAVLNRVSRQMLGLVNDLLDVARLESGIALRKEAIDLRSVIQDVIEVQQPDAAAKRIDLTVHVPHQPLIVFADPARLTQAFTNLVRNAVLYTPMDGLIVVEADCDTAVGRAWVRVHNSGIGIAAEHIPHLFEPFFRVTEGGVGAGLGLYITREIVDLHDGAISVTSTPDVNTTFTITLTLHQAPDSAGS